VAGAKVAFEPAAPDPDLVENHRIPQGHKQWDILTYARLTQASALTEGVDLASTQQLVAASLSITPSEHGIIATLSKRLIRRQGDTSVMSTTGTLIANSLRRRQANDVIALYDGFSKSVVGANTQMDVTHFRGSVAYLLTDNSSSYGPAPMPLHAALHIEQISDIILDISDPGTAAGNRPAGFGDDLLQRWWRGNDRLYGIPIFHSGNISRDSSGDSKGAIFAKEALVMVMANNADVTEETDESVRAVEVGIFQEWSEGERADAHGVEVYSDTAATV
tara:strand:+ start:359 stop:1189 length:831 start_codon:yes stop_codon:yes gene_type:complete